MINFAKNWVYGLVLLLLILGGLWVRIYKIGNPIADWHSWRQADTAAVTRNFVRFGVDLMHPRFDDLSSVASGKENPQGWRFVEFPIYNLLSFWFYGVLPGGSMEVAGRWVSIMASMVSAVVLASLVGRYKGRGWGIVTAAVFLFLPFNIYYSRVILPEPLAVGLALSGYWFFVRWWEKNRVWDYLVASVLWAAAILVKPTVGFLGLPICYLVWLRYKFGALGKLSLWGFAVMVILPFLGWREWMSQFPEGIPANRWLLNGDGIRLRPAWWRWLLGERLGRLILGIWGLVPFVGGFFNQTKKEEKHLWGLAVGAVLYLMVFATGNVRHDYYQIVIMPAVVLLLVWGIFRMWTGDWLKWRRRVMVVFCLVLGWGLGWYQVRDYYNINRPEIVEAGRRVNDIAENEAKVIAPYNGDTAFLYQTGRQGWPVVTKSIEEMIKDGAGYYVAVDFDQTTKAVIEKYQVLEMNNKYVIVKLTQKE